MSTLTSLTGVAKSQRGFVRLKHIYKNSLLLLNKFPADCAYKVNTERILRFRQDIVLKAGSNIKEIEDNIKCGTIEILIMQAEAEYSLIPKFLMWKVWEPIVQSPPPGQWKWPAF